MCDSAEKEGKEGMRVAGWWSGWIGWWWGEKAEDAAEDVADVMKEGGVRRRRWRSWRSKS